MPSLSREVTSSGRRPTQGLLGDLADRFADRTEAKVATASTSVPAPVSRDERVNRSATPPSVTGSQVSLNC